MKKYLVLLLSIVMLFTFAACGNTADDDVDSNPDSSQEVVSGDLENVEGDTNSEEIKTAVQNVEKSDFGLTMTLNGDYADCTISDLDESSYLSISDKAIGGFDIKKVIDGTTVTLSTVVVVDSDAVSTPEQRAKFPYIFAGSEYSIVATSPNITIDNSDIYEKATQLQAGMVQQLCTIFFDESVLLSSDDSATTEPVVEDVTPEGETIETDNVVEGETSDS